MELQIKTKRKREVVDITDEVENAIHVSNKEICHLFILHTTAALATADLDPGGTDLDYLEAFERMVPKLQFRHPHDPSHMPDHILSTIIGTSLTLPLEKGKLILGTWQRIVLFEFDGPRTRRIIVH